jgi:hypothetical protein
MNTPEDYTNNKAADHHADPIDSKAYQHVLHALQQEPAYTLPATFADKVVRRIETGTKRSVWRDYFWPGCGIFFLLIAFVVAVAMSDFTADLGFLKGARDFKGILVFGISFMALLNWLDKRIIQNRIKQSL